MARNYSKVRAARATRFHQSTNQILNFVMSSPLPSWTLKVQVLKCANNLLPSPFAEVISLSVQTAGKHPSKLKLSHHTKAMVRHPSNFDEVSLQHGFKEKCSFQSFFAFAHPIIVTP